MTNSNLGNSESIEQEIEEIKRQLNHLKKETGEILPNIPNGDRFCKEIPRGLLVSRNFSRDYTNKERIGKFQEQVTTYSLIFIKISDNLFDHLQWTEMFGERVPRIP